MIPIPTGVRVWLATGQAAFRAWLSACRRCSSTTPWTVVFSASGENAGTTQHSAYGSRHATIVYPWHPFFGMTLQISHNRRGKKLKTIHTDLRPGYSRELPGWMLDPSCCAGMAEGSPQVSIEGLNELATLLASLGKTRKRRAASSPLTAKERRRAEKRMLRSSAAQSGIQKTDTAIPSGEGCKGAGGSIGGPAASGDGTIAAGGSDGQGQGRR